uniref:NAB domain-containing protein n=1 Tax=Kalanchoe fedtschenkoi TaxID=63787 RepID=A0A7N0UXP2_KALFE
MEDKVGSMLTIIDDDGDSFAKRAEMYYRKRPELVHLVEESFRAYRALAERYDHISRDLQSANRTIATVYPEKVHFTAMEDDEYEEQQDSSKKLIKPAGTAIPKPPASKVPTKTLKPLPTFKTKKAQQRQLKRSGSSARAVPCSGLTKGEALEEIDKLQKGILALQTEKEFVKSLYENAVANYLEIENRINEMQVKVCGLQDEFGIGTVIEDNEARKLMASTALKSCQETLNRLKEKQEISVREANMEQQKIKEAHRKLQAFKQEFYGKHSDKQGLGEESMSTSQYQTVTTSDHEAAKTDNVLRDLQSLEEKTKELEDLDGSKSLTVTELVDKIDEIVDKVVHLETAVASSSAMVQMLRSEGDGLQEHVQALELDKDNAVEDSDTIRQKMVEVEAEMVRLDNLNQTVENQNTSLSAHFTQASYSLDQLSEKLENSKFDEMGEIDAWNGERMISAGSHLKISGGRKGDKFLNVVSQILDTVSDNKPEASTNVDDMGKREGKSVADEEGGNSKAVGQGQVGSRSRLNFEVEGSENEANRLDVPGHVEHEQRQGDEPLGVLDRNEASCSLDETFEKIQNAKADEKGEKLDREEEHEKLVDQNAADTSNLSKSPPEDCGAPHKEHVAEDEEQPVSLVLPEAIKDDDDDLMKNQATDQENKRQDHQSVEATCHDLFETSTETQPVKLVLSEATIDDAYLKNQASDRKCKRQGHPSVEATHIFETLKENHTADPEYKREESVGEATKDAEDDDHETKGKLESVKVSTAEPKTGSDLTQDDLEKEKLIFELGGATADDSKGSWRELVEGNESEVDWRRMFLSGLEDREKFLVDEYTSVIKTLKEARRKLSEVEKRSREGLTEQAAQMKRIMHANSLKDKEIQSLRRTLSLLKMNSGEKDAAVSVTETSENEVARLREPDLLLLSELGNRTANDATENTAEDSQPARPEIILNDEPHFVSSVEEKFRSDLDEMLGENLEFWLRFCTSVHQIQKFKSSIEDLQIEATRVLESKKQETNAKNLESLKSDAKPIYKHLKEIQTELKLWLENNSLLKEELESRHSSLSDIQEDITRLSNVTEDSELSEYQVAKFQGEVANMKQENNKVADELQSCLGRVRRLQNEIDETLLRLNDEFEISESKPRHSRNRIPLRTFLFGVKLKKQKQPFFKCMSPALQKQYSDLASQFPPPR